MFAQWKIGRSILINSEYQEAKGLKLPLVKSRNGFSLESEKVTGSVYRHVCPVSCTRMLL